MVSAIIINYFCAALSARSAASILADRPGSQVIVVDNSADSGEAERLRQVLPVQVELVVAPENLGFGRGCNLAYERCRHDLILLLNPDAYLLPGCLERLIKALQSLRYCGAVSPCSWWDTESGYRLPASTLPTPAQELGLALAQRYAVAAAFQRRSQLAYSRKCHRAVKPLRQKMLSGGHMLLRRGAIEGAGGLFDAQFFMYYEDADLCQRLLRNGFGLYLVPAAGVVHEWCATQSKNDLSLISRDAYFAKHYPHSRLGRFMDWICQRRGPQNFIDCRDLGVLHEPLELDLPVSLAGDWYLQIGINPQLAPAIATGGAGQRFDFPAPLWQHLGPGHYWLGFYALNGAGRSYFSFRK